MSTTLEYERLSGPQKAAILLMILGEDAAASIFRNLPEEDLHRITNEVSRLGAVPAQIARRILEETVQMTAAQEYIAQGGTETANRILSKAFGEAGAKSTMHRLLRVQELTAGRVESLQKADPKQLARLLELEHPQTIALILGHLDPKQASALLMHLPREQRAESVRRLANLRQFSPMIAERVSTAVNRRLRSAGEHNKRTYSGFQSVAALMNSIDSESSRQILEKIDSQDPKLAGGIRELMFTFEDFLKVDEIQLRALTAAVDKRVLSVSLRGASDDLKSHFYSTMSSRAIDMLKEDTDTLGPVRQKDMLRAQSEMVALARQLEDEGKMVLKTDLENDYV